MKILLLSAYDAVSHQYWRKGLVANLPQCEWTVLTLPPRYFSWRMRGNSLSWAFSEREVLEQQYDLIIATSMTDLSALRGFVPCLAQIPTLVYFHENQFAYPESGKEYGSVEPKILNLYTALAADHICFNTDYNRQTLLQGCRQLLKKLPDHVPAGIVDQIEQRSSVLQVPLPSSVYLEHQSQPGPLQLVWNHRWEFDKGPELLLAMAEQLLERTIDFRLHVVGQQFRKVPDSFALLHERLADKAGYWGFMESVEAYRTLLQQSDLVLSTALHDFQGIAVLEGVAAGCVPVVPQRLAYTELFPGQCCYSEPNETKAMVEMICRLYEQKQRGALPVAPDISALSWDTLAERYYSLFQSIVG